MSWASCDDVDLCTGVTFSFKCANQNRHDLAVLVHAEEDVELQWSKVHAPMKLVLKTPSESDGRVEGLSDRLPMHVPAEHASEKG